MKSQITYDDFAKLDIRVGEVTDVAEVEGSGKLLKLTVNLGEELGTKTIFSGIKKWYTADSLRGRKLAFVTNLLPKKFKIGDNEFVSEGMIVAADSGTEAVLFNLDKDVPPGSIVK